MERAQRTRGKEFLVTFFSGEYAFSRLLSDILKSRESSLLWEELMLPKRFRFSFFKEEGKHGISYFFRYSPESDYEVTVNGQPCIQREIQSGDYFLFQKKNERLSVRLLFIATDELQVGYEKYQLPKGVNLFIGRTPANEIAFGFSDFISREKHAAIRIDEEGNAYIEDLKRSVGIYVNHRRTHSQKLQMFDEIFLMGLSMVYMGEFLAVRRLSMESSLPKMDAFAAKAPQDLVQSEPYFVGTPRVLKSLEQDEIEVDGPPNPFVPDQTPAILAIGPSFTMCLVMLASLGVSVFSALNGGQLSTVIASGVMAVGMLLGSLMWPMLLKSYQKRRILAQERLRKERYTAYIAGIEQKLAAKKQRNIRLLNEVLSPPPETLCILLDSEDNRLRLWERSNSDDDFLAVRIGTGNRPFDVQLKIPKQGFQLYEDPLRNLPAELADRYHLLTGVPLTLDLQNNSLVGFIGSRENLYTLLWEILLNLIALHPYDEVKLAIVTPPKTAEDFAPFLNVPHIWSADKRVRFFATTPEETHFLFGTIEEEQNRRENVSDSTVSALPHYVLVITDPALIEQESILRRLEDPRKRVGITILFAYGDIVKLPKFCTTIVQSDKTLTGYYIKNKNANRLTPFVLDLVDFWKVEDFAQKLSRMPIRRDFRSLGIPDRVPFLQMYRVGNVEGLGIERRWDNNHSERSLAAPIGVAAGGHVFCLDLHEAYHGCHGLVAGTTGSGKSEFLQALVLSLAVNYSPREVAFVLIDFKGGDMARPFLAKPFSQALPHLAATISNLSGNTLHRALVSLEAEIKSRQRILNQAALTLGVDKLDINSYQKYWKDGRLSKPLPHLIIIIDEFAQLKVQQPDFLTQLINVSQVGRSLGLHLILATQKPSGIVDPQIMGNFRFKVCLKVADKQDSLEMMGKPDAASIKNPGRLYLQVGYDEIYESLQSGYSGAGYLPQRSYQSDEEITVQMTDFTAHPIHSAKAGPSSQKSNQSQLEAIVAEIVSVGQQRKLAAKPLWLVPLPKQLFLQDLPLGERGLCTATVGLIDDLSAQAQPPLTIDFAKTGNLALYGAGGSGKTTFLQCLVDSMVCGYGYTPEELNLYVLDFGGRNLGYLEELPHTGGVAFSGEDEKVARLSALLHGIIDERKRLFAACHCSTFSDFRAVNPQKLPAIVVLVDHYAVFREQYPELAEQFTDLLGSGNAFGVYFVLTGNTKNSIHYKVAEFISMRLVMRMNDPNSYLDLLGIRPPVPPEATGGRGIILADKKALEFQAAFPAKGQTQAERVSTMEARYQEIASCWDGSLPACLGGVTTVGSRNSSVNFVPAAFQPTSGNRPDPVERSSENLVTAQSLSGAFSYGLALGKEYQFCVCAKGTESLYQYEQGLISQELVPQGRHFVYIGLNQQNRGEWKEICTSGRYLETLEELDAWIEELKPELNARLENPDEPFEEFFLIIPEFCRFFEAITDEQAAFMRKFIQYINSPCYHIYFICGFDVSAEKNNDRLFLSLVAKAGNYLLCPGCYEEASLKVETLPALPEANSRSSYLCLRGKSVEVRW